MTSYLINLELWGAVQVAEITYEKRTALSLTGVKHARDIVGRTYYLASRVEIHRTTDTLEDALARARRHIETHIASLRPLLDQIEAAQKECSHAA